MGDGSKLYIKFIWFKFYVEFIFHFWAWKRNFYGNIFSHHDRNQMVNCVAFGDFGWALTLLISVSMVKANSPLWTIELCSTFDNF